jgi:hypothetical protein
VILLLNRGRVPSVALQLQQRQVSVLSNSITWQPPFYKGRILLDLHPHTVMTLQLAHVQTITTV